MLDASDPNAESQYETVCDVLDEIGANENPRILLLNKIDKCDDETKQLEKLRLKFPDALCISAKEQIGFVDLKDKIYNMLYGEICNYIIPVSQTILINELRKAGCIQTEEWLDDGVHISARAVGRLLALASPFVVE